MSTWQRPRVAAAEEIQPQWGETGSADLYALYKTEIDNVNKNGCKINRQIDYILIGQRFRNIVRTAKRRTGWGGVAAIQTSQCSKNEHMYRNNETLQVQITAWIWRVNWRGLTPMCDSPPLSDPDGISYNGPREIQLWICGCGMCRNLLSKFRLFDLPENSILDLNEIIGQFYYCDNYSYYARKCHISP